MQPQGNEAGPGTDDTFAPKSGSETNPFTADLKGDFTSNFGTNTNAVSQIFKEGGFGGQNRTKYLLIGGAVLILLAVGFFALTDSDSFMEEDPEFDDGSAITEPEDPTVQDPAAKDAGAEDSFDEGLSEADDIGTDEFSETDDLGGDLEAQDDLLEESLDDVEGELADPKSPASAEDNPSMIEEMPGNSPSTRPATSPVASGTGPQLAAPADGARRNYDETSEPAEFQWEGSEGGTIVFSRSTTMVPEERRVRVSTNSYMFQHPYPGTWYWRVETPSGTSEVRSFVIDAPIRRNIMLTQPQAGGALAGEGGIVSWSPDKKVTHYRVEITNGSWANPAYRFSTAGNSVGLSGVPPGQYSLRIGGFSEVSGRWEYTAAVNITVQ